MIWIIEGTLMVDFLTGDNTIPIKMKKTEFYKKGQLPVPVTYQIVVPM